MIQRKKSLRQYALEKRIREGKPLFARKPPQEWPRRKSATLSRPGAQGQQEPRPARKAGLKPVSSKRAKENREYSKRRRIFLAKHPRCAVFPKIPSTDVHHSAGREGALLLDESKWLAVSRQGHTFIHENPNTARELGFSAPRGA